MLRNRPGTVPDEPSRELLRILACPVCGASLAFANGAVECSACSRTFPCEGNVPVMYHSSQRAEANAVPGPLARVLHRVAADPRAYNGIQRAVGYGHVASRLRRELEAETGVILDVGAGTGAVAELVPKGAEYIWLDYDRRKLAGFRARGGGEPAVLGHAQHLPFSDQSVDAIVFVDVSHHLDDEMFSAFLAEAARVTRGTLLFVDALHVDSAKNRLLWRYDAGAVPRELRTVRRAIDDRFTIEHAETFDVVHRYFLCRARPSSRPCPTQREAQAAGARPSGPANRIPGRRPPSRPDGQTSRARTSDPAEADEQQSRGPSLRREKPSAWEPEASRVDPDRSGVGGND